MSGMDNDYWLIMEWDYVPDQSLFADCKNRDEYEARWWDLQKAELAHRRGN